MKAARQIVLGLLALTLLLSIVSTVTAIRASRLENRLQQAEASLKELQSRHYTFATTVSSAFLRPDASPYTVAEARVAILRESLELPVAEVRTTSPPAADVNSLPYAVNPR